MRETVSGLRDQPQGGVQDAHGHWNSRKQILDAEIHSRPMRFQQRQLMPRRTHG
jgi:hypothetical protein